MVTGPIVIFVKEVLIKTVFEIDSLKRHLKQSRLFPAFFELHVGAVCFTDGKDLSEFHKIRMLGFSMICEFKFKVNSF